MRAIQMTEFGGPEVLKLAELPTPAPAPGEVLIKVTRAGLNFADTHTRTNSYVQQATLPLVPGGEVAGVREDTGERVVVHAAAGGVGSIAAQLGHPFGAGRVIATASSEEKRNLALELGADVAVDPDPEGLTERLIEANEGRPVDVVFEMSGGAVFDASYKALAPFGRIVAYGIATNEPNQVPTGSLLRHSRAVVGFYLFHCLGRSGMFAEALSDLFARAAAGELKAVVGHTYPLEQAAQAQIDLRERRTTGKLLLDPAA